MAKKDEGNPATWARGNGMNILRELLCQLAGHDLATSLRHGFDVVRCRRCGWVKEVKETQ